MKVTKISDKIIRVHYPTQEELCRAFLRVEEHYESPEFKGKVFTLGQFRQWYTQQKGAWTYYGDWGGFNVPGCFFRPFLDGMFDPLAPEEKELVELFRNKDDGFYVIGTSEDGEADILDHELCHALWGTNEKYKTEILAALVKSKYNPQPIWELLHRLGYHSDVIDDETHAYMSASSDYLAEHGIDVPPELVAEYRAIKKRYLP
jgi:hypothetical protein